MHEDRTIESRPGLELREQPVHIVDVPGALDLRHHYDLQAITDFADQRGQLIECPGRLERVDPRPQSGPGQFGVTPDSDQPVAGRELALDRHAILEVAEHNVALRRERGNLRRHALVRRVEEVDHPRGRHRYLAQRHRRADRERLGEVSGVSHVRLLAVGSVSHTAAGGCSPAASGIVSGRPPRVSRRDLRAPPTCAET